MRILIALVGLMLLFTNCTNPSIKNASPTYGEAFFAKEDLVKALFEQQYPSEGLHLITEGWEFLGADSLPGIDRRLPEFEKGEPLQLPHRVNLPNHSLWYRTQVDLEKGYLLIDSDDGAQLWINGERLPREEKLELFQVKEITNAEVIVRSVNNAMSGGLRKVFWISESDFSSWESRQKELLDSLLFQAKFQSIVDDQLLQKLDSKAQQDLLVDYPILLTEPVLLSNPRGGYFIRWISEEARRASLIFEDGRKELIQSNEGVFTYDLEGEGQVRFMISQGNSLFGPYEFQKPKAGDSVKLAIWADSQGGWDTFQEIAQGIESHKPDLSIGAGDLVNNGSEPWAYPRFLQKLSWMKTAQLLVPGNHDYDGFYEDLEPRLLQQYIQQSGEPSYGMSQLGPAAILSLDPNVNFPVSIPEGTDQGEWLEATMDSEAWNAAPWKIIVLHQPPYSQGWPGYQGEAAILDLLEPYFHQGKVDLLIAGHTHDYERLSKEFSGHSVQFLIVGGAGGGLEPEGENSPAPVMDQLIKKHHYGILELDQHSLNLEVVGKGGEVLDAFQFKK